MRDALSGGDDQRVFWAVCVALGYCFHALLWTRELMHATLLRQILDGFADFAACELLDGLLQKGIFLADDLIKLGRVHSGLLQLLERFPSFDSVVLARVADEDHAVSVIQAREELVHLSGARQTRFVHEVEAAAILSSLSAGQVMLQGMRGNAF